MADLSYLTILRRLWSRVLEEDEGAINDNDVFFDLGGDSLTASELVDAAEEEGLIFTVEQLFNNPSLQSLASCVGASRKALDSPSLPTSPSTSTTVSDSIFKPETASTPWLPSTGGGTLTPWQKHLVNSNRPLNGLRTWRRAKLDIEIPLARIRKAFDDISRAQPACRARLHRAANDTYAVFGDSTNPMGQYRFHHSLYCNLSTDAVQRAERESFDALDPEDGPVFSVDVYRFQGTLFLFLATSNLFLDESSLDIILNDFERTLLEGNFMVSPPHEVPAMQESSLGKINSYMEPSPIPDAPGTIGDWGLRWTDNHPNVSVSSAVRKGHAEETQGELRMTGGISTEDAVIHILDTLCARFGRFTANIMLEKFRPHCLERLAENLQETPIRWATKKSKQTKRDHGQWRALRQQIRGKLYDVHWSTPGDEVPTPSDYLASADVAIYVSNQDLVRQADSCGGVIYDIHRPCDKPGEFDTSPRGFVEVYLSTSSRAAIRTVCTFDSRNRQAEALKTWAETLWEDVHSTAPSAETNPDVLDNCDSRFHGQRQPRQEISADDEIELAMLCNIGVDQIEDIYPCSPMQESLTVGLDGNVNPYVMQLVFQVTQDFELDRFQRAWEATVQANAALRTRVCRAQASAAGFQVITVGAMRWQRTALGLDEFLGHDASKPMIPGDPFFRYTLVEDDGEGADEARRPLRYFVWTAHHALCDGASILMILDEVSQRFRGERPRMREPFSTFIRSSAVRPDPEAERDFWRKVLSELDPTPYPQVPPEPDFHAAPNAYLQRPLTLEKVPAYGITEALFLRAAWTILMSHYTGTEDVCFGAVNSGRNAAVPGIARTTGPTINVTPVAFRVNPQESVASFFSRFRTQSVEMMPFEHSGVSQIRRLLAGSRATAVDFQSILVVHPKDFNQALRSTTRPLGIEYLADVGKKEQHPYPLLLSLTLSSSTIISLGVQYDERVISTPQIQTLVHHFQTLLTALGRVAPNALLGSITLLSDYDMGLIAKWNGSTPPAEETCVDWLFRDSVAKQPNAVAVCSLEQSLTYTELEIYSSSVAAQLVGLAVQPGHFVGVCFEKSIWTAVAIMAVFKAGAVYVPIDPGHPPGRIQEVVETTKLRVALASRSGSTALDGFGAMVVVLDGRPVPCAVEPVSSRSTPAGNAYLLFTSGSTGKPKGILISHSSICTSIKHHGAAFGAGPHWRTFQFCAHTFDMSIGEFLTTLAYGGCVCIPSEEDRMNDLAGAITALGANTLLVVPTVANILHPEDVPTLKTLILGGEPVTRETVVRWAAHVHLTCSYGPSETSVWCAANLRVSPGAHPANIGRSIGGTMWIAHPDDHRQLSAVGCVGEIVISGGIVGQGYFANKAATDAAFVPAPEWLTRLDPASRYAHSKVYKSGDLARYGPDGTLNIVGRLHTQVKLHGYRIELGEIENQVMATGLVTAALAVLPRTGPSASQIVAILSLTRLGLNNHSRGDIVVSWENHGPVIQTIKSRLRVVLPHYMIPTVWAVVDRMPLLISGKVDRKAIQTWSEAMDEGAYKRLAEQTDPAELDGNVADGSLADTLRGLWSDILATAPDRIRPQTRFSSLGGDSLAAMRVASRAKALGIPLTARSMIGNACTLQSLVALVEESIASRDADTGAGGDRIDWDTETAPPLPLPHTVPRVVDGKRESAGMTILLTGATGFFGRAVVRVLHQHPGVDRIHCLAVRNTESTAAQHLVRSYAKVKLHPGDLSQVRLGLGEDTARRLFSEASAIVHNGAEVSFLKGYEALRAPNVGSTRELVRLSWAYGGVTGSGDAGCRASFRPSMHYVSGTGVAALALLPSHHASQASPEKSDHVIIKPVSLLFRPPPSPISPVAVAPGKLVNMDGYVASKWASEALIEKAVATTAAGAAPSAHIYRLSNVTGPDAPELDLMHNIIRVSRAMKAVPRLANWSGRFDFISAETAAKALVDRLVCPSRGTCGAEPTDSTITTHDTHRSSTGSVQFVHLSGEVIVPVPELKAYLEQEGGETFIELELADWLGAAAKFGLSGAVGAFLGTLAGEDSGPCLPSVESSIF